MLKHEKKSNIILIMNIKTKKSLKKTEKLYLPSLFITLVQYYRQQYRWIDTIYTQSTTGCPGKIRD